MILLFDHLNPLIPTVKLQILFSLHTFVTGANREKLKISRELDISLGSTVGTVDKHSPHLCVLGLIPVLTVSCGLSLLLVPAILQGLFSRFSGFPPSTKINSPKFQFDLYVRASIDNSPCD